VFLLFTVQSKNDTITVYRKKTIEDPGKSVRPVGSK